MAALPVAAGVGIGLLQAVDAVVHRTLGAEDNHRKVDLALPQRLDQGKTVEPGQHDVDDGPIVAAAERQFQALRAVTRVVDQNP